MTILKRKSFMSLTKIMKLAPAIMAGDFSGLVTELKQPIAALNSWMQSVNQYQEAGGQLKETEDNAKLSIVPLETGQMMVYLFFFQNGEDGKPDLVRIESLGPVEDILKNLHQQANDTP
jgi:hypothetical protein